ncbi:MAG: hypothetical protein RSE62_03235 [Citrobacter sp.]
MNTRTQPPRRSPPHAAPEPARQIRSASARARAGTQEHRGEGTVSSTAYEQETRQVHDMGGVVFGPGEEPAFIKVSAGKTISLTNFEFLRLDVAITLPCRATNEDVQATYETASNFVAEKLAEEEISWMGATNTPAHRPANRRG